MGQTKRILTRPSILRTQTSLGRFQCTLATDSDHILGLRGGPFGSGPGPSDPVSIQLGLGLFVPANWQHFGLYRIAYDVEWLQYVLGDTGNDIGWQLKRPVSRPLH